jgi:hypothetical protein
MGRGRPVAAPGQTRRYSTFPIVEREEIEAHGRYLSRDLCLLHINALAAGDPDAMIRV